MRFLFCHSDCARTPSPHSVRHRPRSRPAVVPTAPWLPDHAVASRWPGQYTRPSRKLKPTIEGGSTVADVLELSAFDLARRHRQSRMLSFQGLYTSQLIRADGSLPLFMPLGRQMIGLADVSHIVTMVGIVGWCQPVANQVWLQIPLFSNRWAWRGEMLSTIPRRMISSAISRPVHWLMGRPDCSGASQANDTIWQTCSAVMTGGLPARGSSSNRSVTVNSSNGILAKLAQRFRHNRIMSLTHPLPARSACCSFPLQRAE